MVLTSKGVAGALICCGSGLIGMETPEGSAVLNSEVFRQTFVLVVTRASVSLHNLKLIAQPMSSLPY